MFSASRKQIVSLAGLALAVFWPFVHPSGVPAISSNTLKLLLTCTLALLAFGVQKRSLSFFNIRGFGWRDLGAMLAAIVCGFELIFVASRFLERFAAAGATSEGSDTTEISLAAGLVTAVVAGVTEEFIYRGFIIEELGELVRSRWLAGAFSVLVFSLAHYDSGYGWSLALLYPGLIGLVITSLYFWRRNLLLCILMHVSLDALHEIVSRM